MKMKPLELLTKRLGKKIKIEDGISEVPGFTEHMQKFKSDFIEQLIN